jgi:uncharacterized protein YqhQ
MNIDSTILLLFIISTIITFISWKIIDKYIKINFLAIFLKIFIMMFYVFFILMASKSLDRQIISHTFNQNRIYTY